MMVLINLPTLVKNLINPKKYVMLGLRGSLYDPKDFDWARDQGVTVITIDEYYKMGFEKTMNIVKEVLGDSKTYLTFDIDGIDPTFAPGTGTPEPGGWTFPELESTIHKLEGRNVVGGDVVELSPDLDPSGISSVTAACVVREILLAF